MNKVYYQLPIYAPINTNIYMYINMSKSLLQFRKPEVHFQTLIATQTYFIHANPLLFISITIPKIHP